MKMNGTINIHQRGCYEVRIRLYIIIGKEVSSLELNWKVLDNIIISSEPFILALSGRNWFMLQKKKEIHHILKDEMHYYDLYISHA